MRRADGKAEDMDGAGPRKILVWQAKEFTFYPDVFRVHWKDLEHGRDTAILRAENGQSCCALQDLLEEGAPG